MPDPKQNIKKLYEAVSKEYDLPDFKTFSSDMQDIEKRNKLYTAVSKEYDLPDFDTFSSDIGTPVKKKGATRPTLESTPSRGSLASQGKSDVRSNSVELQTEDKKAAPISAEMQKLLDSTSESALNIAKKTGSKSRTGVLLGTEVKKIDPILLDKNKPFGDIGDKETTVQRASVLQEQSNLRQEQLKEEPAQPTLESEGKSEGFIGGLKGQDKSTSSFGKNPQIVADAIIGGAVDMLGSTYSLSGWAAEMIGLDAISTDAYQKGGKLSEISQNFATRAKTNSGIKNPETSTFDHFLQGEVEDGFRSLGVDVLGQIPNIALAIATGGESLAVKEAARKHIAAKLVTKGVAQEVAIKEAAQMAKSLTAKELATFAVKEIPKKGIGEWAKRAAASNTTQLFTALGTGSAITEEYAKDQDISALDAAQSVAKGVFDGFSENIFNMDIVAGRSLLGLDNVLTPAGRAIRETIKRDGKDAALKQLIRGWRDVAGKFLKGGGQETIEENVVAVASFIIDAIDTDNLNMEGFTQLGKTMGNATLVSFTSGSSLSGAAAMASFKPLTKQESRKIEQYKEILANENISLGTKNIAKNRIEEINAGVETATSERYDKIVALPIEDRIDILDKQAKIQTLEADKVATMDVEINSAIDERITELNAEIDAKINPKVEPTAEEGVKEVGSVGVGGDKKTTSIFHGTTSEIAKEIEANGFDVEKGADGTMWFTSNKSKIESGEVGASVKGGIVERTIDESTLKLGGYDEQDKYSTGELINMGYDGLKLVDDGEITYQIFEPNKLGKKIKQSLKETPQAGSGGVVDVETEPVLNNPITIVNGKQKGGVVKNKLSPKKMVGQLTKNLIDKGNRKELRTSMGDVGFNYKNGDVEVTLSDDFDFGELNGEEQQADVSINFIGITKPESMKNGLGSKELDRIVSLADLTGTSLSLTVDPQGATFGQTESNKKDILSYDSLKGWYKKRGFVFDEDSSYGYRKPLTEKVKSLPAQEGVKQEESNIPDIDINAYEEAEQQLLLEDVLYQDLSYDEEYARRERELQEAKSGDIFGNVFEFLHENLGRIKSKDYNDLGDSNKRKDNKAFNILYASDSALPLDVKLIGLSERFGREITSQDVIDYIEDRTNNPKKYNKAERKKALKEASEIPPTAQEALEVYRNLRNNKASMDAIDELRGNALSDSQADLIQFYLKNSNEQQTEFSNERASRDKKQGNANIEEGEGVSGTEATSTNAAEVEKQQTTSNQGGSNKPPTPPVVPPANNTQGGLTPEEADAKVVNMMAKGEKQIRDGGKKDWWNTIKRYVLNRRTDLDKQLNKSEAGQRARKFNENVSGSISHADDQYQDSVQRIYAKHVARVNKKFGKLGININQTISELSGKEEADVNAIIFLNRVINIDQNTAKKNKKTQTEIDTLTSDRLAEPNKDKKKKITKKIQAKIKQLKEDVKHPDGFNESEAKIALEGMKNRIGDKAFTDLEGRANAYSEIRREMLREMHQEGLISDDTLDNLLGDSYVERKFLDHIFDDSNFSAGDSSLSSNMIKALMKGSEGLLITDARLLLHSAYRAQANRIATNKANTELANAVRDGGMDKSFAREAKFKKNLNGTYKKDKLSGNRVLESAPIGMKPIYYYKNGERHAVFVRTKEADQWNDTVKLETKIDPVLKFLSGTKVLKTFATLMNPLFAVSNTFRDFQKVLGLSDTYDKNVLTAFPRLLANFSGKASQYTAYKVGVATESFSKLIEDYTKAGGKFEFLHRDGKNDRLYRNTINRNKNYVVKLMGKSYNMFENAFGLPGEISEISMRLAVFDKKRADLIEDMGGKGNLSKAEMDDINILAANASRAIMDYNKGGLATKWLDNFSPYLNASVVGFVSDVDYIAKNPKMAAAKLGMYSLNVAAITLFNAINSDEEDYKNIPDYVKDNYYIFFIPGKFGGVKKYLPIPKYQGLQFVASMVEEATLAMWNSYNDANYGKADSTVDRAASTLATWSPIPFTPRGVMMKLSPSVQAGIAYFGNYDSYRDQTVEYEKGKVSVGSEGLYNKKIARTYKVLGDMSKALGPDFELSPSRTQAAMEKIITNPRTNFLIGNIYGISDWITQNYQIPMELEASDKNTIGKSIKHKFIRDIDPAYASRANTFIKQKKLEINDKSEFLKKTVKLMVMNNVSTEEMRAFIQKQDLSKEQKQSLDKRAQTIQKDIKIAAVTPFYDELLDIKYMFGDPEAKAIVLFGQLVGMDPKSEDFQVILESSVKMGILSKKGTRKNDSSYQRFLKEYQKQFDSNQ
jgi:hypothetical protein